MVLTEYLTKWVEAEAVSDKSATSVLAVLLKFVCRHGCPEVIITDQGREFCNALNDLFSQKMGIEHRIASAYHPQTGGHTERYNRTLCTMLSAYVQNNPTHWEEKLPYALFAYRTAEHSSTKATPFYLVYGRQARLPVEIDFSAQPHHTGDQVDNLSVRCDAFVELACSREEASRNIRAAQAKQKKYHDAKVEVEEYQVGEKVLVHNTRRLARKGGKLGARWTGPYSVKSVLTNGTYALDGVRSIINGSRLKKYMSEEDNPRFKACNSDFPLTEEHSQGSKKDAGTGEPSSERIANKTLPLKKRKVSEAFAEEEIEGNVSEEIEVTYYEEAQYAIPFEPVGREWQTRASPLFNIVVRNNHNDKINQRTIRLDTKPTQTVRMRGDGNCLFRTLSYVLCGVQSHHKAVRDKLVEFIRANERLVKQIENETQQQYLARMKQDGTWGTELEIFAFATITQTTVYVYCSQGTSHEQQIRRWLPYRPVSVDSSAPNQSAVYIQNLNEHFEPVLDVQDGEYSRPPYRRIRDHVPRRYWHYVSDETLDGALVNSHKDETTLEELEHHKSIFVRPFTDTAFDVPIQQRAGIDPNVFNFLCDWENFDKMC